MKRDYRYTVSLEPLRSLLATVSFSLLALTLWAAPQAAPKTPAKPAAKTFDSPQQAAEALIAATEKFDEAALEAIFGPEGRDIILTGEDVADREKATSLLPWHARSRASSSIPGMQIAPPWSSAKTIGRCRC